MTNSMVSVLVPVYNVEKFLPKTIENILSQSYKNLEIIFCDDGSTDNCLNILKSIEDDRVRILKNSSNMGISWTRNRLFDEAQGEYIAIWDADDLCPIDRIEVELNASNENDADVVFGFYQEIDENNNPRGGIIYTRSNPKYIRAGLMFRNMIPNSSALVRRDFINNYNIRYNVQPIGDYSFWVDCSLNGAKFFNVEELMLKYRVHSNNITTITMKEKMNKRKRIIYDIQKRALSLTGIVLDENDYECINDNFCEDPAILHDNEELKKLYEVLKKVCVQADELGLDNTKEIKDFCRNSFSSRVNQARFLWE